MSVKLAAYKTQLIKIQHNTVLPFIFIVQAFGNIIIYTNRLLDVLHVLIDLDWTIQGLRIFDVFLANILFNGRHSSDA